MKCPIPEIPIKRKIYDTTEINRHNETIKPCHLCSLTKRTKCQKKRDKIRGTSSSQMSLKKQIKTDSGKKKPPLQIEGKTINRRWGFKIESTNKILQGRPHNNLIKIPYVKTRDRYGELIHS